MPETIYQSRAAQVAGYIRQKLAAGEWRDHLPGERVLAETLGVSRWSVRAALVELQKEGWLGGRGRQGATVRRRRTTPKRSLSVGLITNGAGRPLVANLLMRVDEMRQYLESHGVTLQVHRIHYTEEGKLPSSLKTLLRQVRHDVWTITSPTLTIEDFCQNHSLPFVLIGAGLSTERKISSIATNNEALCRHAVGEMLRRGHRHLALLLTDSVRGEDLESQRGFEAGVRLAGRPEITVSIVHHDMTKQGVKQAVNRLLATRPRPTAWLICRQGHFLSVYSYLQHLGISIPGELSLISRDSDAYIDDLIPEPTRYVSDPKASARRSARWLLRLMEHPDFPMSHLRIMPEFIRGETLGDAPR